MMRLNHTIRRWRAAEDGSVAVETLMMVPLMVWAFLATIVYFDAYRTEAVAEKATLTVADMLSRETDYIDNKYMNGAQDLLQFLTLHDPNPRLRITVIRYDQPDPNVAGSYDLVWSRKRGTGINVLRRADVRGMADQFPIMSDGERAIFVETWTSYTSRYRNVTFANPLEDFEVQRSMVISPRFTARLCWTPDAEAADAQLREIC